MPEGDGGASLPFGVRVALERCVHERPTREAVWFPLTNFHVHFFKNIRLSFPPISGAGLLASVGPERGGARPSGPSPRRAPGSPAPGRAEPPSAARGPRGRRRGPWAVWGGSQMLRLGKTEWRDGSEAAARADMEYHPAVKGKRVPVSSHEVHEPRASCTEGSRSEGERQGCL